MIIKSIGLENFRQYKGVQNVEFSTDGNKKITVILGQNTCGKTTLVRAFAWCLYGGEAADVGFKKGTQLINEEEYVFLAQKGEALNKSRSLSVTLVIETLVESDKVENENGVGPVIYTIKRKRDYTSTPRGVIPANDSFTIKKRVGLENEVEVKSKRDKEKIIEALMPRNLSQYFFYWGEQITDFDKKDLDSAVKSFLGLDVFEQGIKHLKTAKEDYFKEVYRYTANSTLQDLIRSREEKRTQEKALNIKLDEKKKEAEYYEGKFSQASQEFYTLKEKARGKEKLKEYEQNQKKYEDKCAQTKASFRKTFNHPNLPFFIMLNAEKRANKILDHNKDTSEGWVNISVSAIDEIIKKGTCICGACISGNQEVLEHLQNEKRLALPNSLGGIRELYTTVYENAEQGMMNYMVSVCKDLNAIAEAEDTLQVLRDDIEELNKKDYGEEEVEAKKKALEELRKLRDKASRETGALENQQKILKADLVALDKKITVEQSKESKRNLANIRLEVTQKVLDSMTQKKRMQEEEMSASLRELTKKYFDQIYTGCREIEIDKRFKLKVLNKVGSTKRENETSPGLDAVKNFAFIAALITIAKETIHSKSQNKGRHMEPYPLVLDAPFSQVDDTHIANICQMLVDEVEQTAFVMMEKDWHFAKQKISPYVGDFYVIDKKSETHSIIKKEDLL